MLNVEKMKRLKRVSVTKDTQKAKDRIKQDFKSADKETKAKIVELSGLAHRSFYSVYKTGVATARPVLAMAQLLDVTPYYYTGAADERGSCTEEELARFLIEHGYEGLLIGDEMQKRKYSRKQGTEPKQKSALIEEPMPGNEGEPAVTLLEDIATLEQPELSLSAEVTTEIKPAAERLKASEVTVSECILTDISDKMREAAAGLDDDTTILLLRALLVRAKAGGLPEQLAVVVKHCLLH